MRSKIVRATINDSATQDQVYTAARFTAVGSNPTLNFEVRPDPAVPLYQINALRNPAITDNGQFSPKKAADLLVSKGHFGHQMAQAAGAMFSDHFVRNDNSLLYYKGFILLTFLRDAEEAALVPNVVGVVGNVLVVNVQDVADFPILVTGIQSGALTVGATAFTDDELNILATIMRGFPVYQMPAAGQNRATYMLNQVAAPGLTLMILAPFHQPNPVIDVCSSHRMLALLLKLATVRGEKEDLVRGFTRASTLVNGRCRRMTNLAAPRAIVTTTAEIGAVSVPLVADCNALLWILDPPIVTNDEFSADFLAIASASTEELVLSSIAVGCAIGVCTSTIFLSYNIRGQQLNGAMGGPGQNSAMATAYIRDNAIAPSGAPLCRLWGRMAGSFLSYCSWVVSPTCFYGRGWSCALTAFDIPAPNTAFARLFDNEAPFVVSALCILWAFDVYPLQWGIPMRGTSIDSSSMVVQATADGFSPLAGCPELLERAINTRNRAWRSSYPGLVINCALQALNLHWPAPPRVRTHAVTSGQYGSTPLVDRPRGNHPMGNWDAPLCLFLPGGAFTYEYMPNNPGYVISPMVPAAGLTPAGWASLRALDPLRSSCNIGVGCTASAFASMPAVDLADPNAGDEEDYAALCSMQESTPVAPYQQL